MGWSFQHKPPLGWPLDYDSGLVPEAGFWPMLEDGSSIIQDLSGNENHGVKSGGVIWEPGKFGPANHYDGTTGYHDCGDSESLHFITGDFTFVTWVKLDQVPTSPIWFDIGGRWSNAGGDRTYELGVGRVAWDGFIFWLMTPAATEWALSATTATSRVGLWTHVVGVRRGVHSEIYINGLLDGTDTSGTVVGPLQTHSGNFLIGSHADGFWDGSIGPTSNYNRGLTAFEITKLFRFPYCMYKDPAEVVIQGGQVVVGGTILQQITSAYMRI